MEVTSTETFAATELLDALGKAVIATDLDGTVRFWNRAAERLYGWTAEEAIGENIRDLSVPELAQDVAEDIMQAVIGGRAWSGGYGDYSFTNFADPDVRAYNIALAEEAAELGFDDILYDYIRRPDGDLSAMVFPGLVSTPEEAIACMTQCRAIRADDRWGGSSSCSWASARRRL